MQLVLIYFTSLNECLNVTTENIMLVSVLEPANEGRWGGRSGSILHYADVDTQYKRRGQQNFRAINYVISDHRCIANRKYTFMQETLTSKYL
jgi:hypothetical protein